MKIEQKIKGVIYLTEPNEIHHSATELLKSEGYQVLKSISEINNNQITGLFIRTYTHVTKNYLDKFNNLKYILRAGVGVDNIDLRECNKRNIKIFNSPGTNKDAVAEYILAMAILMLRKIPAQIDRVKSGQWRDFSQLGSGLIGKSVGLIGCGNVGRELINKMKHLDVNFIVYDPYVSAESLQLLGAIKTDLNTLLKTSDIIAIMIPLTQETKNLINKSNISLVKNNAVIINVSRGEVVDQVELISALQNKSLGALVLDVLVNEPIVDSAYLNISNLIITPHIAGLTIDSNEKISIDAVANFLEGQDL